MAEYKIIIKNKEHIFDSEGDKVKKSVTDLGIKKNVSVRAAHIYEISGNISAEKINRICGEMLVDPVAQEFAVNGKRVDKEKSVEVYYKDGVTDTVSETVQIGIRDIGIDSPLSVKTGKKYLFAGDVSKTELKIIAENILSNEVVQRHKVTHYD